MFLGVGSNNASTTFSGIFSLRQIDQSRLGHVDGDGFEHLSGAPRSARDRPILRQPELPPRTSQLARRSREPDRRRRRIQSPAASSLAKVLVAPGTYNLNGRPARLAGLAQGKQGSAAFNFSGTIPGGSVLCDQRPVASARAGNNGVFDTNGNTLTLAGGLSGSGSLTKIGSGMLAVSGVNTSTRATRRSTGGTLEMFSDNASSSFTANSGGTLYSARGDGQFELSLCSAPRPAEVCSTRTPVK